jgi:3-oxoacyl-[acyl-carrier-protein] synthase II
MGVVSALGIGKDAFWAGLQSERSPVRRLTHFSTDALDAKHAAWIEDWQPRTWIAPHRLKRMDRCAQMAVVAAHLAVKEAGIELRHDRPNPRAGVSVGTALGGFAHGEHEHRQFLNKGEQAVPPALGLQIFPGSAQGNLAIEFGLQGHGTTNANTCAAGNAALGDALRLIQYGAVDVLLAGAAESPLAPMIFAAFDRLGTMSAWNAEPAARAYRPFHRQRDGFVMGEGSAMFVVESLAHARRRGATIYAELLGYAATNEAYHMSTPDAEGAAMQRAMRLALEDARVQACDIDYVNAHASGTQANDGNELQQIRQVFGEHAPRLAISGTKPFTGHTLGAAGSMEIATCLLALQHQWAPPTLNLDEPDAACAGLNVVANHGQERPLQRVLSNSFGFGGIDTSLVLGRV